MKQIILVVYMQPPETNLLFCKNDLTFCGRSDKPGSEDPDAHVAFCNDV